MLPEKIYFFVEKRPNVHCKNGQEWAVKARFDNQNYWTIIAWEREPSVQMVDDAKTTIMRACEFFYRHIKLPRFKLVEGKDV